MRSKILAVGCVLVLGTVGVSRATLLPHVIAESNGSITMDFVDDGVPDGTGVSQFYVAIANEGNYHVSASAALRRVLDPPAFIGGESIDSLRARSVAADTVRVFRPFLYRGTRVLYIQVNLYVFPPGSNDVYQVASPRVTVTYDPAPTTNTAQTADPMLVDLVANGNVFPSEQRSIASPDPWFSLAPTWVKIPVTSRGLYTITGQDLADLGVTIPGGIVDPSTLRLFSQFGEDQPRDFTDPAGTWRPGNAMREAAILVEAGSDGTFDRTDRIVFYGLGTEDWQDYYDSSAPDTVYHRHIRAKTNYYFLTWDSALPGTPRRVAEVSGPPSAGPFVTTAVQRDYFEQDRIADFDFHGDGWLWLEVPEVDSSKRRGLATETVTDLDATRPQIFRSLGLANYRSVGEGDPANLNTHTVTYGIRRSNVDVPFGVKSWTLFAAQHYENGVPVRISGNFLQNGANPFYLDLNTSPNPRDAILFAWFSVFYHRFLNAPSGANAMGFTSPDTSGAVSFSLSNFDGSTSAYVFDVTEAASPVRITGASAGTTVRFGDTFAGERRHYWVAKTAGLVRPSGMTRYTPSDLRADATGADMLIITHEAFAASALRLRSYREQHMPYVSNPRVKVAFTRDIFDNFSGGMPDAMAIRNYIKFMFDNYADAANNPRLRYVLFLGDATEDFRQNKSVGVDYVPSNLYLTRRTSYAFMTDEWYGHLDEGDQLGGFGVLDVAIGRLPAATSAEARVVVDKIIGYETDPTFGDWRKKVVLVADDELSSSEYACDVIFTGESESIAQNVASAFLDLHKIYLTEYPRVGTIKPASRVAFLREWNDGALIINFIGHGSSRQMADEQVFIETDVGLLENGRRLPLLCALSCTIGDFANAQTKSLSEKLILREAGGVIGTVTASRETFANLNERLDFAIFNDITPRLLGQPIRPVGETLMRAKMVALYAAFNDFNQEENNWKYNLLTDPALTLRSPQREVRFETGPADTLTAGVRKTIRGAVYAGGAVDAGFNGNVSVTVREPQLHREFFNECVSPQKMSYYVPGGVFYQGTADVVDGRFRVNFRVPRSARTGPLAFITAYADDGVVDAAATLDSVLTLVSPTAADSSALEPLDGAPRVTLGFKSGLKTVKPGETLQAIVHDRDGIDILNTTNEGKQALLLDAFPLPLDANDYFEFDHGGADTSGVLLFPLPELSYGSHRAIYKVSDAFGQTTLDTLVFSVTDPQDYFGDVLLNYPNPFKTDTQFLVRLSDRATIQLDIFTVSGRRIRRIVETRDGGEVWIPWDGRDAHGAEIANGTYLYVARIAFAGIDRPARVVRGKLSKIQ